MDSSVRTYMMVLAGLLALLVVTIVVSFVDLGVLNLIVAVGIAITKGLLIMIFFMHLRTSSSLVRIFAIGGFFWLLILILLTMGDYLNRVIA